MTNSQLIHDGFLLEPDKGRQQGLLPEQSRPSEQDVREENRLLREIIDNLPIGLTVQDDHGRFILANAVAAANLGTSGNVLIGASPADFLPEQEALSRREWERSVLLHGEQIAVESRFPNQGDERAWLTLHTPAQILDRPLLISSAIEITEHK